MRVLDLLKLSGIAAAMVGTTCAAQSQSYPTKPVRIVTATPGSGSDVMSRIVSQRLTPILGQQVIVDNRGGGGIFPAEIVARSAPDGYTLLYYSSTHWLLPYLRDKAPYDPLKDFSPITLTVIQPNVLVVHPSLPVTNVTDLIALARSKPGDLNYATGGRGSPSHLAGELFNSMAKVNIVNVHYKGAGPALTAVLGTEIPIMFAIATNVPPHLKAGRLRALGVTSAHPIARMPELPTLTASGLPGYEFVAAYAFWAPARTPAAITTRLNREIVQILRRPDVTEPFLNQGIEVVASTPEQLVAHAKAEMSRMGKVIREAGIRAE